MDRRAILGLLGTLPLLQLVKSLPAEATAPIPIDGLPIGLVGFSQGRASLASAVTLELPPDIQAGDIIFVIAWPDANAVAGFTRCHSCGITVFYKLARAGDEEITRRKVVVETLNPDIVALSLTVRGAPITPEQSIEDLRRSL